MTVEQHLDSPDRVTGRRDRELLARDLEQRGAVDVHRREFVDPGPRIEAGIAVDEPGQNRISLAQMRARPPKPRRRAAAPDFDWCWSSVIPRGGQPGAVVDQRSPWHQGCTWLPTPRSRRIDSINQNVVCSVNTSAAASTPVYFSMTGAAAVLETSSR